MTYEVVFDAGKPWSETFEDEESLTQALKDFYEQHKYEGDTFDVVIYDEAGIDISESQSIQEIIAQILEEDEDK
jgi:deoxyadenosine/deoxycytidine kinase